MGRVVVSDGGEDGGLCEGGSWGRGGKGGAVTIICKIDRGVVGGQSWVVEVFA